jgi:hypothetical protein
MFTIPSFMGFDAAGFIDPDAAACFARVTAAGGTLSNTEKNAVNTLVVTMKANGIWTPMKAVYPMVGASAAACAQNLKSSSFTGTFTSGWTFASTGVTPNGTSAYFNTTVIPSSNLTSGNTHASVYIRTNTSAGAKQELGSNDTPPAGGEYSIITKFTGDLAYPIICSTTNTLFPTYSNTNSQGFWVINRENTTNIQYYNRSTKVVDTAQTNGMSTRSLYVGARNSPIGADRFSDRQNAFVSIGDGLTSTQASNFYTAVQAFQTTLSRNV